MQPEPEKTFYVGGNVKIDIYRDECPPNPREEDENLGKLVVFKGRTNESGLNRPDFESLLRSLAYDALLRTTGLSHEVEKIPLFHVLRIVNKRFVCLAVHGRRDGSYFTDGAVDASDERCDGLTWVSMSDLRDEGMVPAQGFNVLKAELEAYSAFCTGEAYGYVVTDPDMGEESCWGFWSEEDAETAARDAASTYRVVPQLY
jgi:hypothetical protein